MSTTETVSRLRRLADDWRKEEKQLCEQFGSEIIPRSMRARRLKDTQAIDAAVEMIERLERVEAALRALKADPWPTIINGMITPAHISRPTVADPDFDQEEADALTEYLQQGLK